MPDTGAPVGVAPDPSQGFAIDKQPDEFELKRSEASERGAQTRQPRASGLAVSSSMIAASLAGLGLSVSVPLLLPATEYAVFATAWAIGQLIASLSYEWMRYSVLRFGVGADPIGTRSRRHVLARLYIAVTAILLIGAAAGAVIGANGHGKAMLAAIVLLFAAANGAFDGHQALSRAEFRDADFARGRLLRTVLSLVLSLAAARFMGNAAAVLLGLAVSFPLAVAISHRRRPSPPAPATPDAAWPTLRFLFGFGLFAALGSNLSMLVPALQRMIAVGEFGLAASAGTTLAFDLAQKAVSVTGLAVNVVMMQRAIRVAEFGRAEDQPRQAGRQIAVTYAFVAPATTGFYLIAAPFAQIMVSDGLRAAYLATIGPACLSAGLIAFRLFAVDPLFVVRQRTRAGTLGPLATAGILAACLWTGLPSAASYAWVMVGAAAAGLAVALIALLREGRIDWPWPDLARATLGCLAMAIAPALWALTTGISGLASVFLLSAAAYVLTALALDTGGCRKTVRQVLQ
ncbi:MAG: hypothetical protein R3E44_14495 [Paracoccaceae bacterium]